MYSQTVWNIDKERFWQKVNTEQAKTKVWNNMIINNWTFINLSFKTKYDYLLTYHLK